MLNSVWISSVKQRGVYELVVEILTGNIWKKQNHRVVKN